MNITRENVVILIGAIVATLLQIIVAPNIALFSATPNFMVAYALVVALVRPNDAGPVLPFVLGLISDLLGGGPVGATALLLTLASTVASRAFALLDNDTLFMPLAILVAGSLLVEVFYGVILMALGLSVGFLEAFIYRALPCALFDCIIGLILYPLLARLFAGAAQSQQPGTTRLR